jgi:O-antigen ligase
MRINSPNIFLIYILGMAGMSRMFSYLSIGGIHVTEIVIVILFGTLLSNFRIYNKRASIILENGINNNILVITGLYILYGSILLLFSGVQVFIGKNVIEIFKNYVLVYYAVFVFIAALLHLNNNYKRINMFYLGILISSTLVNTFLVINYTYNFNIFIFTPTTKVISGHQALFAIFSCIISLNYFLNNRNKYRFMNYIYLSFIFINTLFVYLSGHRSGILALTMSSMVVLILQRNREKKFILLFVGLFMLPLMFSYGPVGEIVPIIFEKYKVFVSEDDPNVVYRSMYWNNVMEAWKSRPVFGIGFTENFIKYMPGELRGLERNNPHNSYITVIARMGVIGLLLLLLIKFYTIKLLINNIKNNSLHVLNTLGCFLAISIYAFFNVTLEGPYHGVFYWILIGIAISINSINKLNRYEKYNSTNRISSTAPSRI